ncbi:MAG: prealbumin-like fold domain-containing protein [bacterium]|nr:prealbumin-like fold domain-containing protein [bacterium]
MFFQQLSILVQICTLIILTSSCETNYTPFTSSNQTVETLTVNVKSDTPDLSAQKIHLLIEPTEAGYQPQKFLNVSPEDDLPALFSIKPSYTLDIKVDIKLPDFNKAPRANLVSYKEILALVSDSIAIVDNDTAAEETKGSEAISITNMPKTIDEKNGHFSFLLIADQKYKILFNPNGKNGLPPSRVDSQINTETSKIINLDYKGSFLSGNIIFKQILPNELSNAYSVKIMQNEYLVSSVNQLDQNGKFSVQLASPLFKQSKDKNKFTLIAFPETDFQYLPIIEEEFTLEQDDLIGKNINIIDINVATAKIEKNKTLSIVNNKKEPIAGAKITLKKLDHKRPIIQNLQTDKNGQVTITVLRGTYTLNISFPTTGSHIIYQNDTWKVNDSAEETITLANSQKPVLGKVVDYNDEPVAGALISITRTEDKKDFILDKFSETDLWRIEARTNHEGKWCAQVKGGPNDECPSIQLSKGKYQASFIPPPGSKLPYQNIFFTFPETELVSIKLTKPITIHGQINDQNNQSPINKAFVKIYAPSTNLKQNADFLLLGQAITNESGEFVAYIILE